MKLLNPFIILMVLTHSYQAQGRGIGNAKKQDAAKKEEGQDVEERQDKGQGQGQGQGQGKNDGNQGNSKKPPENKGGNGNGSGRPCGVGIGPDDNPGAEKRSSRARANFDNLPRACDNSSKIDVVLGNGKTKTFHKGRSAAPGLGRPNALGYWSGTDVEGGAFNFVRDKHGFVHGSLTDLETGNVHQFGVDSQGEAFVTITPTELFAPEVDPSSPEPEPDSRTLQEFDSMISFADTTGPNMAASQALRGNPSNLEQQSRSLAADFGNRLDVMVIWTKKAECKNAKLPEDCAVTTATYDTMQALVELAVAETNTAFTNSLVRTQLNLVHSDRHATYVETSFSGALQDFRGTSDGKMDDIHDLRDKYGADIVHLIIDNPQYCGIGYLGPRYDLMFSVSAWNCATGYYTFGHEIGHNLGLNHDRGTKDKCSSDLENSNYGYRDPNSQFRTIMAYPCTKDECDNNPGLPCSKVQMFSNVRVKHGGKAVGSAIANNAAKLTQVAAQVAAYKTHVPNMLTCSNPVEDPFKLILTLDNYPAEVTWEVTSSDGVVILSGGPYAYSQQWTTIEVDACLPKSRPMQFTIKDSYGDGICCGYGQGGYKLYWANGLKRCGGAYQRSEATMFGGCNDFPNWMDTWKDTCSWYVMNENPGCPVWANRPDANGGMGTPGEACCHCGGGIDVQ